MATVFEAFRSFDRRKRSKEEIELIAEETLPEIEESECDDNVSGESNFADEYDDDDETMDALEDDECEDMEEDIDL